MLNKDNMKIMVKSGKDELIEPANFQRTNNERIAIQGIFYVVVVYPICFALFVLFASTMYIWLVIIIMFLPLILIGLDIRKNQKTHEQLLKISARII